MCTLNVKYFFLSIPRNPDSIYYLAVKCFGGNRWWKSLQGILISNLVRCFWDGIYCTCKCFQNALDGKMRRGGDRLEWASHWERMVLERLPRALNSVESLLGRDTEVKSQVNSCFSHTEQILTQFITYTYTNFMVASFRLCLPPTRWFTNLHFLFEH